MTLYYTFFTNNIQVFFLNAKGTGPATGSLSFSFISGGSCKSPDREDRLVAGAAVMRDAPFRTFCLDDLAVAVINRNMSGVDDDVAGTCFGKRAYFLSRVRPFAGGPVTAAVSTGVLEDQIDEV